MDIDQPAGSSSAANPLSFLEKQEAAAPAALQSSWTKIRTAYEKKCVMTVHTDTASC